MGFGTRLWIQATTLVDKIGKMSGISAKFVFFNPFTPKLIIQILLIIQEQMYEGCIENW